MPPERTGPPLFSVTPTGFKILEGSGGRWWILREGSSLQADPALWDGWTRGRDATLLPEPGGRGPVYLLAPEGTGPSVLRQYRHGGLVGRFLGDRFLGTARFLAELSASEAVRREGVATPEILALYISRMAGAFFRGWILTRQVPCAMNLRQWAAPKLPGGAERHRVLRMAAGAVASLHSAGCFHRDLNLSNLLLAGDRVWVLDLDGARQMPRIGLRRRSENLLRLYRSVVKETGSVVPLTIWDRWIFLKAYSGGDLKLGRALWRRLRARWALARARRGISRYFRRLRAA